MKQSPVEGRMILVSMVSAIYDWSLYFTIEKVVLQRLQFEQPACHGEIILFHRDVVDRSLVVEYLSEFFMASYSPWSQNIQSLSRYSEPVAIQ